MIFLNHTSTSLSRSLNKSSSPRVVTSFCRYIADYKRRIRREDQMVFFLFCTGKTRETDRSQRKETYLLPHSSKNKEQLPKVWQLTATKHSANCAKKHWRKAHQQWPMQWMIHQLDLMAADSELPISQQTTSCWLVINVLVDNSLTAVRQFLRILSSLFFPHWSYPCSKRTHSV